MYHEVLHGYLNYERSRIGETEFNNRYPAMESYDVKLGDGTTMKKFYLLEPIKIIIEWDLSLME